MIVSLERGGAESMLSSLVAAMIGTDFEPIVFTLRAEGELAAAVRRAGVRVVPLGGGTLGALLRLRRALRVEKVDLVQTWMYHADLVGGMAARSLGIPVVWGVQSGEGAGSWRSALLRRLCARVSHRLPSAIICCAHSTREIHRRIGYVDRISVVPNACDVAVYRPDPAARSRVRHELQIGDEDVVIGMIARADPLKDHDTLVRAVASLDREVVLVLAGSGIDDANAELAGAIRDAGLAIRCRLLGRRDDVPAVLAALDVFVLSSRSEGLPLSLVEAMATGVPAVTTDVGDCATVLGDLGRTVPPGDVAAMVSAIEQVIRQTAVDRSRLAHQLRRRAEVCFSLSAAVEGYAAVWRSTIGHA